MTTTPSFLSRLMPKSLVGQLVLATAIALFIAQAVSFALLARGQAEQRTMRIAIPAANRIIEASDRIAVGQTPVPQRRGRRAAWMAIHMADKPLVGEAFELDQRTAAQIRELLNEANIQNIDVRAAELTGAPHEQNLPMLTAARDQDSTRGERGRDRGKQTFKNVRDGQNVNTMLVSAQLPDRRWFNMALPAPQTHPLLFGLLGGQTALLYLLLLAPIAWIGWRVSRPLKTLTQAARATDPAAMQNPVPESGPADVSELTRAFNAMRSRIVGMLSEKDRMLGALGHDLRTPLASLRVRVESVADDTLRGKMIATMDEMAVMLDDILALARSGQAKDALVATDVGALLSAVVEDYRDVGSDVSMVGVGGDAPSHIVRKLHPVPMRRVLRNLIDNALKYGQRARVSLSEEGGQAVIIVADDGPGIAPERIAEMMEPFTRAEGSRSRETGGAGLGLALAKTIVAQQGGELRLSNGEAGGLVAKIILG